MQVAFALLLGCAAAMPAQAHSGETGGIGGTGISPETGGIGGTGISHETGGIGGTGIARRGALITGYGPIQAFGSVFVDGREYAIDARTVVTIDGAPATVSALRVGEIATVNGAVTTPRGGYASEIAVLHPIIGQVTQVSRDGASASVLGQRVVASAGQAPFTGVAPGARVAISGLLRPDSNWVAQRVTLLPPGNMFQLAAVVTSMAPGQLSVAGTTVQASPQLTAQISAGERIIVTGSISPQGLRAAAIAPAPVMLGQPGTVVEVENYFHTNGHGQLTAADGTVASGAPAGLALSGQQLVEIQGDLSAAGTISIEQIDTDTLGASDFSGLPGQAKLSEPAEMTPQPAEGTAADLDKAAAGEAPSLATQQGPEVREPAETVPEIDLQDLHPEIPEIEAPEIRGPSGD